MTTWAQPPAFVMWAVSSPSTHQSAEQLSEGYDTRIVTPWSESSHSFFLPYKRVQVPGVSLRSPVIPTLPTSLFSTPLPTRGPPCPIPCAWDAGCPHAWASRSPFLTACLGRSSPFSVLPSASPPAQFLVSTHHALHHDF